MGRLFGGVGGWGRFRTCRSIGLVMKEMKGRAEPFAGFEGSGLSGV